MISMSPRESLERVISFKDYIAIGFGVMIGVGWVVYAGQWLQQGGVLGAVLAFVLGGLMLVPIGKCYAELTAALPVTGGEVAFTYKAFGPFVSFFVAWLLSLGYMSLTPFETIAIGTMVEAIFPALSTNYLYEIGGYHISWTTTISGLFAGGWVMWLNWRGAKYSAKFQTVVIAGMLLSAVVFCAVAFWKGNFENLSPLFSSDAPWQVGVPVSIASVLVVVPFFLTGFDCIPQAAEESGVKMLPRQLGVAIVATILMGILFYIFVIVALGYSVSSETLSAIMSDKNNLPMAEVFRSSFEMEWAARLVLFAGLLGIISTLNGIFMAATRLLFAQGRGGLLPHWFAELHPVYHTPKNAILFAGALMMAGPFIGKAALMPIVSSYSFVLSIVMLVTALSTLKLRKIAPNMKRPYQIKKVTIWVAITAGVFLVGLMTVPGSPGQLGQTEFVTISLWMILGLIFNRLRRQVMSADFQMQMILGGYR